MDKHAYLIIANNNWDQLLLQLQLLDHEKNDIFLMIDAKSKFNDEIKLKTALRYSKLIFVDRMKIFWGGIRRF